MFAEIIAIGSEMLTPYRQDSNSLFLTGRLNDLGISVAFKTVVGDNGDHLTAVARTAIGRADIAIFMGGLGPTQDDLTRESVAAALGISLKRDHAIVTALYKRFAERRIQMPGNNAQQADVLEGAELLPNHRGTAPGQWLETSVAEQSKIVVLLPGPPHELHEMWDQQCMDRLRAKAPSAAIATRVLKVAMMGESAVDARTAPIYKKYPNVETTLLAGQGQVEFHLRATAATKDEAQAEVDRLAGELEDELEDAVFSSAGESLEEIVSYYLQMRNAKLAVAESCTGGMIAERITSVPGSSRYFLGGAVVYSNDLKTLFADIPPLMIEAHGAVSKEVALALAENIREICNADIGVGVTGVAGPGGGTEEKPVGLVYVAVTNGHKQEVVQRRFFGDRDRIRRWASQQALDLVRRMLM
ncbi:MAG TPA: competence/damage-inducible protein A [Candidatus Limnocylindrales bacterium]|nr:competence/damage-inducible protein A [Candidatus Limnocylindrales bacterium]